MSEKRAYQYAVENNAPIDETGTLAQLETRGRRQVTVIVDATTDSTFALEAQFDGADDWKFVDEFTTKDSVVETRQLSVAKVRLQNETAQEAGETADVKLGTS